MKSEKAKNLMINEEYYTQEEVATMLNYTVQTVIAKRKKGLINSMQFCPRGRVFINKKEFHEKDMERLRKQNFDISL